MALTKTVTKVWPSNNYVGLHLELKDDDEVVIDKDFKEQWSPGAGVTNVIRDKIGNAMQKAIDKYKSDKALFDAPAYGTVREQVDNALDIS